MSEKPYLYINDVHKHYGDTRSGFAALRGISFRVDAGEFVAVRGPSGCGKSTLLHILGAMDQPSRGEVWLNARRLDTLGLEELARVRRRRIGFVFQAFNLLPTLTAAENVSLPLTLDGVSEAKAKARAQAALDEVALVDRADYYPSQLSGGEMQRVAIARAVVIQPELLLADEPTGSLDSSNGRRVLELLAQLNKTKNLTVLIATHSPDAAGYASRTLNIRDGQLDEVADEHVLPTTV